MKEELKDYQEPEFDEFKAKFIEIKIIEFDGEAYELQNRFNLNHEKFSIFFGIKKYLIML